MRSPYGLSCGMGPGLAQVVPLASSIPVIPAKAGIHCGGWDRRLTGFWATLSRSKAVCGGIYLLRTAHWPTGDEPSAKAKS